MIKLLAGILLWCAVGLAGAAPSTASHPGMAATPPPLNLDPSAAGVGPRGHLSWYADPDGSATIHTVSAPGFQGFQTLPGDALLGFQSGPLWLRLTVHNQHVAPLDTWLELAFPHLDHVTLYQPVDSGAYSVVAPTQPPVGEPPRPASSGTGLPKAGSSGTPPAPPHSFSNLVVSDLLPFADRSVRHRTPLFPVLLQAGETRTLYLRIESRGSIVAPLRFWSFTNWIETRQYEETLLALSFGASLALITYYLLLGYLLREKLYHYFVLYAAISLLMTLSLTGHAFQYLWPDLPWLADRAWLLVGSIWLTSGVVYVRAFLDLRVRRPLLYRRTHILLIPGALCLIMSLYAPFNTAARAVQLAGLITLIALLYLGCSVLRENPRPARLFLIAYSVLLVGVALTLGRNMALLDHNLITMYGLPIATSIEVLVLAMALTERVNNLKDRHARVTLESTQLRMRALELSEQELERRVQERTRQLEELTGSLQREISDRKQIERRLRQSEETMRHMAHHDALTGLPNRFLLPDRFAAAVAIAQRKKLAFAVVMLDLDRFKEVNDQLGHDIGDALLVEVARRLEHTVRGSDTVARLGGDEFVLLLNELQSPMDARRVAECVLTALGQPMELLGHVLQTSPSLGVAIYGTDGHTMEDLLKHADIAMYRAKEAGRNTCFFYRDEAAYTEGRTE